MPKKRIPTQRQLENLRRGREKLFKNQLKRSRIPKTITQTRIVREPIIKQITSPKNINFQISIFKKLLDVNLFSIRAGEETRDYNLRGVVSYLLSQLNEIQKSISNIIHYIVKKDKVYQKKLIELEKRISDLEKN